MLSYAGYIGMVSLHCLGGRCVADIGAVSLHVAAENGGTGMVAFDYREGDIVQQAEHGAVADAVLLAEPVALVEERTDCCDLALP